MWFFKKRVSLKDSGIFDGFTDWHSHILPGVDDGVQTMDESLEILHLYEELGVKTVWLTPHIMEDIPNTTAYLRERFAELQAAYDGRIELHLAAENMLDNLFEERLENNDLLPFGKSGDSLLVETSYYNSPMRLNDILLRIKRKGFFPVLAHPERYNYMDQNKYRELIELGVKFQANIPSLVSAYGSVPYKKLEWLLQENLIDIWGTDTHHFNAFSNIILEKTLKQSFVKKIKQNKV